ncbi:MAG: hypothetical protein ABIR84_03715 [Candidatus Nitrotoga sp.]
MIQMLWSAIKFRNNPKQKLKFSSQAGDLNFYQSACGTVNGKDLVTSNLEESFKSLSRVDLTEVR